MTVFVDALMHRGWQMHGRPIPTCQLFADTDDHDALHAIAQAIGLKPTWARNGARGPHYDLTPAKRAQAIAAGAVPVGRSLAVQIWRARTARGREERRA